ncbi:cystinosin-like isoform X2 [Panulirus ornatus]|uniref:cystinosin-like isoform X2 n=1 Tax=Panulirus ornatus TaxID=150431 RepID=UPI003A8B3C8D
MSACPCGRARLGQDVRMNTLAWLMVAVLASATGGEMLQPNASLTLLPHERNLVVGDNFTFSLIFSGELLADVNVTFELSKPLGETPAPLLLRPDTENGTSWPLPFQATENGKATLTVQTLPPGLVQTNPSEAFALISVMQEPSINVVGDVLGWIYTIAWDVSFLPQIVHNWRRRSVVGLSFDFLTFNFIGFLSYFLFNMGLTWVDEIKDEYFQRHPRGVLHVRLNDVIFPLYALFCTVVQIAQCFYLQKEEGQRVSTTCIIISGTMVLSAVVGCVVVPLVESLLWLDLLYWLSYIKLAITCVKYTPQLWENYRRKSTEGWSIYQVIFDFTGGSFSLVQMFLLAYNYDDWRSVLTDPTKLGLGVLSILFNVLFFMQHYCLYRDTPTTKTSNTLKEATGYQNQSEVTTHM